MCGENFTGQHGESISYFAPNLAECRRYSELQLHIVYVDVTECVSLCMKPHLLSKSTRRTLSEHGKIAWRDYLQALCERHEGRAFAIERMVQTFPRTVLVMSKWVIYLCT